MKLTPDCYQCLDNLIVQAASLATGDDDIKAKAVLQGRKVLDDNFNIEEVSIVVATKIHDVIKEVTRNPDPYSSMKQQEMKLAQELFTEVASKFGYTFSGLLKLAALGNNLDFFRAFEIIRKDMREEVIFAIDDSEYFETRIKKAHKILYLADNAGEVYFDLPLIKWMKQFTDVIYVVKKSAVQNDITLDDLKLTGLENEFGLIINTGTATPGIILSEASDQFKKEFNSADLIIAKGMGYYESLSEFSSTEKIFYCLKAKCQPVADSLEIPINAFVAMFC
jgi:damage-control phosphatase, subfamily I